MDTWHLVLINNGLFELAVVTFTFQSNIVHIITGMIMNTTQWLCELD